VEGKGKEESGAKTSRGIRTWPAASGDGCERASVSWEIGTPRREPMSYVGKLVVELFGDEADFVDEKVAAGEYASAADVARAGFRPCRIVI
jgi:hypothetical protein